ncbi:MAG: ribokinase [candidate division NC10 bacterium]|nr:ribokinase [candidate division NC10 bacterium]
MSRLLVVGSANMDFTVAVPTLPREGQTVTGGTYYGSHGGKGANQAVAARRLGAQVRFLGCIGSDPQGEEIVRQFATEGIPTDGLIRDSGAATGVALIVVDAEGRNQIAVASGANHCLTPVAARAHEMLFTTASILLCQLEIPLETTQWALATGREHGLRTILNPAPAQPLPDALLSLVDCLTPNAAEVEHLSGIPVGGPESAAAAAQHLLLRGVKRVIVTLGAQGALVCDGKAAMHYPAFPVEAVDTTGAGDAFNGALAVGLVAGGGWQEVLPLANAAAALACTKRGAQSSFPSRAEVEAFLRKLKP